MKPTAHGRQPGSRNCTKEFREAVVAEASDPNRSIAEVARRHGLNANMVSQWRRRSLEAQQATPVPCVALLPVDVIELPSESTASHTPQQEHKAPASAATPLNCEIEIDVGKRRNRICGMSLGTRRTGSARLPEVIPPSSRIWIAAGVTDMRSGFNSLAREGASRAGERSL
ncbi:transposase [Burkholderia lata]